MKTNWIPEIMYEEGADGLSGHLPFIMVPKEEEMPKLLFIFESRDTGEFEPGLDGEQVEIREMDLHQYANMKSLKEKLPLALYDQVRICLGLQPLQEAVVAGQKITNNIRENIFKKS